MDRRSLLKTLALVPAALKAAGRVAKLEVLRVKVNRRGNWILTRITNDSGISGIGDASHGGPDERKTELIRAYFNLINGRSVTDIEWLRRKVEPDIERLGSVAAVALSGVEQCLWDIQGKAASRPVYELLGGMLNPSIRNYANINRSTEPRTPEGFAQMAKRAIADGFDAIKLAPFDEMPHGVTSEAEYEKYSKLGLDCAAAVRNAIGPARDLLIDVHSHYDRQHGLELARRFEPLNLFWLEEVTPAKPLADLAAINAAAKMPTAGGEAIYGVKGFYPYIKAGAVDIVMPDVKYCGGVLELKKISALAEAAGLTVAPHGPASPVGNVTAAHVCATIPNFHILEFSYGEVPWRADVIEPAERLEKGRPALSSRPGFGITLNDRVIAQHG